MIHPRRNADTVLILLVFALIGATAAALTATRMHIDRMTAIEARTIKAWR